MAINLSNIPQVNPESIDSAFRDCVDGKVGESYDLDFITYLHENNPGLFSLVSAFIEQCKTNDEYKMMMGTLICVLKCIDIALDVQKLEQSIG